VANIAMRREIARITLLGAVDTPSAASSVAINGNRAYVCDTNEVAVVDISNEGVKHFV
jgi:hypothetical protein